MKINLFPPENIHNIETTRYEPEKKVQDQIIKDLCEFLDIPYEYRINFKSLLAYCLKKENFKDYLDQYFNYRLDKVLSNLIKLLKKHYPTKEFEVVYDYQDHSKLTKIVEFIEKELILKDE